jgi:hypothetical protein
MAREIEPEDLSKVQWKKPDPLPEVKMEEIKPKEIVEPMVPTPPNYNPVPHLAPRTSAYQTQYEPRRYEPPSYSFWELFSDNAVFYSLIGIGILTVGTIMTSGLLRNREKTEKIVQDIEEAKQKFLMEHPDNTPYGQPTEFKDIAPYILINKQVPTEFEFKGFIQRQTNKTITWLGRYPTENGEKKPARLEEIRPSSRNSDIILP